VCVYADCMYKRDGRRWARARRAQRPALVVERFRYSGSGAATQAAGGYGGGGGGDGVGGVGGGTENTTIEQ
jgi:hypothetical protein